MGNEKGLGEVGIFLAKKWIDKVIVISRKNDRIIIIKVLVQGIIYPFHATGLFLYPLKTSENLWLSDVFRGYRKRPVA